MGKRYDYRNDYKGWSEEKIKNHLPYLKDKLLLNVGGGSFDYYLKRISYLENKLNK